MRLRLRLPLLWTLLLALFCAGLIACVVAWFVLLSGICANPRTPVPATGQLIPYNCHGMKVFISPLSEAMLHWLGPLGLLCMALSALAGLMLLRSVAAAWPGNLVDGAATRVRIVALPPGEAPAWVREQWVGLELPIAQALPVASSRLAAGVLSGPRSLAGELGGLLRGRYRRQRGFAVKVVEAVAILERTSPAAADWWRTHAPHLLQPARCFLFPEAVCAVVDSGDSGEHERSG